MPFFSARRCALLALSLLSIRTVRAQNAPDAPAPPFANEIAAFAAWDARNATPANPIVFAGSSSIRLWNTGERFGGRPVVNRGFGGSQLFEVNRYIRETVLRYSPRIVVLYAGDNDINAGRTPDQVVSDYETFVRTVHASDATVDIVFIAIKPSLQRWALWPKMREVNDRIRASARARAHTHYSDLATPMLGADGTPRPELFVGDGLHMTPAGYDVWTERLTPLLDSLQRARRAAPRSGNRR